MKTILAVTVALFLGPQAPDLVRAEKVLVDRPDDPAANTTLGIHYAGLADWTKALPFLAKSKVTEIRTAIETEKKEDGNKLTSIEIGDSWVAAVPKAGLARQACIDRASFWYASVWAKLDDFWKLKLRERLSKLYRPAAVRPGSIAGWAGPLDPAQKVDVLSTTVHSGGAALRLTPNAGKAKNHSFLRSATIGVPAGKVLELSVWILADGNDSLDDHIRFFVKDAERRDIENNTLPMPTDMPVWKRISKQVDVRGEPSLVSLEVVSFSSKGIIWVDDISLKIDGKELLQNSGFEK